MSDPVILNEVRRGLYLDSVALMRMSRTVAAMPGVIECGMMMGTPANLAIMAAAGVLGTAGRGATPGDLVIALSARDGVTADAALAAARTALDAPRTYTASAATWAPHTIRAAAVADPAANLALISVPGAFAAAEARKALSRGLNVMMFSDNVPIADEVALKEMARGCGLLMMGPDCGTAIIDGTPLGFANVVPRGSIGIVGASGTGIQEVSCLIANNGGGISHAIGVGGRDLKADVGGISTLMAIDLLDADPATERIVVISKPPAPDVARRVLDRVAKSKKPFGICFIGGTDEPMPSNATMTPSLRGAADIAIGRRLPRQHMRPQPQPGKLVRGLFAGGTLCAEAQVVLMQAGGRVSSNAPVRGAVAADIPGTHVMLDLGDDEFTLGRPHPMIEPAVRSAALAAALADDNVGVILLDVVLGFGGHVDPAAEIARTIDRTCTNAGTNGKTLIASITGTDGDPQNWQAQRKTLESAHCLVVGAMSDAAELAAEAVTIGH